MRNPARVGTPILALGLLLTLAGCTHEDPDTEFTRRIERIDATTGARQISVEDLLRHDGPLLLLDVREASEYGVSCLPGAHRLPPDRMDQPPIDIPENGLVVTYCTVGLRSGQAATRLETRLGRPVYNLTGGIIAWFNAGGEVVDPATGRPATRIDPYDEDWNRFVRPR